MVSKLFLTISMFGLLKFSNGFSFERLGETVDNVLHIKEESEYEKIGREIGKTLGKIENEVKMVEESIETEIEDNIEFIEDESKTAIEDAFGNESSIAKKIAHLLGKIVAGFVIAYDRISHDISVLPLDKVFGK